MAIPLWLAALGATAAIGGGAALSRRNRGGFQTLESRPYTGHRPYAASDVGFGAAQLKPLSEQFIPQIMRRSRGEGLVGFDPAYRSTLRSEFLQDLEETEEERRRQELAQAASQGLRGGVPLDISRQRSRDFARARASGLADIDIADLEARREDINRATYAQPETVRLGSDIQARRAAFDLAEHAESQPTYIGETGGGQGYGNMIGSIGSLIGSYAGSGAFGPQTTQPRANLSMALMSKILNNLGYAQNRPIPVQSVRPGY